ncbi:MAG: pilus assembly protein CpaE [Gemmataceae bacterium]|nr:pilus assembly protein CpaE [Gemmataceae bacterium]
MPRVILIDPSVIGREMMRTMIAGSDWIFLVSESSNYETALLSVADCEAEGVVVSLDGDPVRALRLVGQIKQRYATLPIVVTSMQSNLLVQAHRLGATWLLDCPVQLDAFLLAMRSFNSSTNLSSPSARGIAFLSSRGGAGSTSLAVNVGCTLAAEPGRQVALVDLDLAMGAAEIALDMIPECRLTDLVGSLDKIDLQLLKRLLTKDPSGLVVLPRPAHPRDVELIHTEHIQRILGLMRVTNSHLVFDLSRGWTQIDLEAMHLADIIVLVAIPELCSTRNAVVLLGELREEGLGDKVRVVMNRVGAYFGSDSLTLAKIEAVLGQPIYWQIPNDYKAMMGAWNAGVPLLHHAPRCKAQLSIAAMAKDLCVVRR